MEDMEAMNKLIKKYEEIERRMLVMDDYDGGMMHMVQLIIRDLKQISGQADKALLDSFEEDKNEKRP